MSELKSDVIVIGAGFSGSLVATLLSRQGFTVTLVDRYQTYPDEFRAEQLAGGQVEILRGFGVLDTLTADVPAVPRAIAGREGKIIGGVNAPHYGLPYSSMIARLRSLIPPAVHFMVGRAISIETDGTAKRVSLNDGTTLSAPLVVLATGMNTALSESLGIKRTFISAGHSLAMAFDMAIPKLGNRLVGTYYGTPENRIDYITVFPFEGHQRANLFIYAAPGDQRVINLQANAAETLRALMPRLEEALGEFTVTGRPIKRLNDIWVSNPSLDGVVVIGDAFQTPCPSAGTGIDRLVSDVDLICREYIPAWLAKGRLSSADLRDFYCDPQKVRVDRKALHDAYYRRTMTTDTSLRWKIHRKRIEMTEALRVKWAKRPASIGMMHQDERVA